MKAGNKSSVITKATLGNHHGLELHAVITVFQPKHLIIVSSSTGKSRKSRMKTDKYFRCKLV